ncbi:MAG: helix-turn-helix domain-containing protein [Eubacteriales bacterium]|nr:helix-turn-helix domain-containing protein [Eubacteriales bacterium]
MEGHRYLISDAAKMVAVEAHVLRYWEEELELPIGRTELGHRYYTRENIETFQNIKKLKEEGLQLKAIKVILQETNQFSKTDGNGRDYIRKKAEGEDNIFADADQTPPSAEETSLTVMENNAQKLKQFQDLVEGIVEKVVKENNAELQRCMEASIAKETDYLLHMQEKREEERFRRLDEAIRAHQKNQRYVAASKERSLWGKLFRK